VLNLLWILVESLGDPVLRFMLNLRFMNDILGGVFHFCAFVPPTEGPLLGEEYKRIAVRESKE